MTIREGWKCPFCLKVYSPDVLECKCQNNYAWPEDRTYKQKCTCNTSIRCPIHDDLYWGYR